MLGLPAVLIDGHDEDDDHGDQKGKDQEYDEDVRGKVAVIWRGESLQTVNLI